MKFTILSHASMLVESNGVKLLTDPWLFGSCYWRSWWNFPKPPVSPGDLQDVKYIYLTHHHWDHFHGPSLRKLPRTATILVPKAHSTRKLLDDLSDFHFERVVELPHAKTVVVDGMRLTSYHYGLALDSTLVVDDGKTVLVNMNDCKLTGRSLRQLTRRHPKVDFLFRSHSSASAYPFCVEVDGEQATQYRTREDYVTEFARTAEIVRPRYAIPFASNHCFLHRETTQYNDTIVSPLDVATVFRDEPHGPADCVVMLPGDSWSADGGFAIAPYDAFEFRDKYLQSYAAEVEPKLAEHYAKEDRAVVKPEWFSAYFDDMIRSLPRLTRAVFKPVVVFETTREPRSFFVADFNRRRSYATDALPEKWDVHIQVHPAVLRDCLLKRMFSVFTASKRLHVRVPRGGVRDFFVLTQLLDMYEYEYFPLRKTLRLRFVGAWMRRWREALDYVALAARMAFRRKDEDPIAAAIPKTV